jgi:O-antigen ligase
LAVAYIGQVAYFWVDWWGVIGRIAVPPLRPSWAGLMFGSPNVTASVLLLLGPLAVAILWSRMRRRPVIALVGMLLVLAVFVSGSRGAYLGLAVGSLALLGFVLAGRRQALRSTLATAAHRPFIVGTVIVLFGIAVMLLPAVIYRFGTGGEEVRIDLWRSALSIFTDHPITGGGPGTWVQLKVAANPEGVPNYIFNNAHNMYLQAAAELGLLGLAAMTVLAWAVIRRLLAARTLVPQLGGESAAVLVSLLGLGMQLLVENQVRLPTICFVVAVVVAWVDAGLPESEAKWRWLGGRRASLLPALGLAGILASVPILLQIDTAAFSASAGDLAATFNNWPAAMSYYQQAAQRDPSFVLYSADLASALARNGQLDQARKQLERVIADDPTAINQIGLAALEAQLGDVDAAVRRAHAALRIGTGEPTIAINAGLIAERAIDPSFALDAFADAIAWSPALAADPFWTSPDRMVPFDHVLDAARGRSNAFDAALIAAYAGRDAEAAAGLRQLPSSTQRDTYLAIVGWLAGDIAGARVALEAQLDANPLDWTAAAWLSRLSRLNGDAETGYRYARWAVAVQGDTAPSVLLEETIVAPNSETARSAGLPKGYPANVYLRAAPPFLPVPNLVLVGAR